jgi:hypothetical protein
LRRIHGYGRGRPGRKKNLDVAGHQGRAVYPRLADHRPEHGPREPWPDQLPPPELPCSLPLPLALEPPDATLTETAPLLDTLPLTPAGPEMTPLLIVTPTLLLASHAPRVVWIETLQLPSKEAAWPAGIMAAIEITEARIVGVGIIFMGTTFGDKFHNLMTMRTVANRAGADVINFHPPLEGRPAERPATRLPDDRS